MAQMCWVGIPDYFNQNLGFSVPFMCMCGAVCSLIDVSSSDSSHFSKNRRRSVSGGRVFCRYEARSQDREVVRRYLSA